MTSILLASLVDEVFPKLGLLLKERICFNGTVASPESVLIHLKSIFEYNCHTYDKWGYFKGKQLCHFHLCCLFQWGSTCILVDSSTTICWMSPFVILGVFGLFCHFYSVFDAT